MIRSHVFNLANLCGLTVIGAWFVHPLDSVQGQTLSAHAEVRLDSENFHLFGYDVTLLNLSGSTQPLKTFWLSWLPGEGNFLPTQPSNVEAPSGWTYTITNQGNTDGYGIRFVTSSTPLQPGSSVDFRFSTKDSPSALRANSPYFPGIPALSSVVYSGLQYGTRTELVVSYVPEPGVLGLVMVGVGIWAGFGKISRRIP